MDIMSKTDLIQQIEKTRNSKVITYVTSDRIGPLNARVAMDIVPIVADQLRSIGKTDNIDLFIYSAGGDTMVPWRLVSMIREYCKRFSVIVPSMAEEIFQQLSDGKLTFAANLNNFEQVGDLTYWFTHL